MSNKVSFVKCRSFGMLPSVILFSLRSIPVSSPWRVECQEMGSTSILFTLPWSTAVRKWDCTNWSEMLRKSSTTIQRTVFTTDHLHISNCKGGLYEVHITAFLIPYPNPYINITVKTSRDLEECTVHPSTHLFCIL